VWRLELPRPRAGCRQVRSRTPSRCPYHTLSGWSCSYRANDRSRRMIDLRHRFDVRNARSQSGGARTCGAGVGAVRVAGVLHGLVLKVRMPYASTYLFGAREGASAPAAVHSLERHVRNALFDTTWLGELTCCTICGYLTYDFTYVIYKRADTMWQFMLHHSVSFAVIWYCNVRATRPHHHQHHMRTHALTRTHRPSARDSSMR